jgi:hypothetical protein
VNIRQWLNNHQAISTTLVLVVLITSLIFLGSFFTADSTPDYSVYYFDLNKRVVFEGRTGRAPVEAPSGPTDDGEPAGVKAFIYACGQCKGSYAGMAPNDIRNSADGALLAYVQKAHEGFPMFSSPEEIQWVHFNSSKGDALAARRPDCSNGQQARRCHPPGY